MSQGKPCQYCGKPFWKRAGARYCSDVCRVNGNRAGMTDPEPIEVEEAGEKLSNDDAMVKAVNAVLRDHWCDFDGLSDVAETLEDWAFRIREAASKWESTVEVVGSSGGYQLRLHNASDYDFKEADIEEDEDDAGAFFYGEFARKKDADKEAKGIAERYGCRLA